MQKRHYLDFEKPIAELEQKIDELSHIAEKSGRTDMSDTIVNLRQQSNDELARLYSELDAWRKTQVARHPERPHFTDIVAQLITDFVELSGDRKFGDDLAVLGGLGKFKGRGVVVIGHEKGRSTEKRVKHNFGMAKPEGYRKAVRLMDMAEKFNLPVLCFVDTAGAYPGIGAEERGQAEAIARSTERCLSLGVPIISAIVGEGGSGGAIALAGANHVMMFEHAIYSVISPEGAASILWRDSARAKDAANAMKITAPELLEMNIVDSVVPEPLGGAHRHTEAAIAALGNAVEKALQALDGLSADELRAQRRDRFLAIGRTLETATKVRTLKPKKV